MITPKMMKYYDKTDKICRICNRYIEHPDDAELIIAKRRTVIVMHSACVFQDNIRMK